MNAIQITLQVVDNNTNDIETDNQLSTDPIDVMKIDKENYKIPAIDNEHNQNEFANKNENCKSSDNNTYDLRETPHNKEELLSQRRIS